MTEFIKGLDLCEGFFNECAKPIVDKLKETIFESLPLIGTMSQFGGLSSFADKKQYYNQIKSIYRGIL